jgi:putative hydrolase of the HAD superfamily
VQIERIWSRVLNIGDIPRLKRFALEFEIMANPVWPMPGFERLLATCRESGLPMGIISNAQFYTPLLLQWFLETDLTDLGFKKDLLIYSFRLGCAKPSPKLFTLATDRLKKMGLSPEAVLYMGNDLQKDILPAKQAGFQTVLFAGDARSLRLGDESAHRPAAADLIITDLSQLQPHITGHAE